MAASFVFSAVVKSFVDKSFPVTLSTFVAKLAATSVTFAFKARPGTDGTAAEPPKSPAN